MILALLPVLFWLLVALTLNKKGFCWRRSFLSASVVWGFTLTAVTEVLSIFKLLTFSWLLVCWAVAAFISVFFYFYVIPNNTGRTAAKIPLFLKLLLSSIAAIAILTFLIASIAAPNNWDSMTYHMSRVVHWIQNGSVAHYPTHILRQLELNPWAEFAIMHLQILSGQDYLANLVQWFSMIGSIIGITLIAKQCGADLRGQIYASVLVVTLPMGILQASSTQNDFVVAFWLVCFVYYGICLKEKLNFYDVLAVGVSLGLALLTKGTAYIYAVPFLLWFLIWGVRSLKWTIVTQIFLISILVLSLNISHYMRNYGIFGNPLTSGEDKYSNEMFSVSAIISNISRNFALHIGTPSDRINNSSMLMIASLHKLLGVDLNEPKTTWPGTKFEIIKPNLHEDDTGNPLHLALIILSAAFVMYYKELRRIPNLLPFVFALSASFFLFCFYLRWQPWASRLHLSLFVLWSAVIGVVLSKSKFT
jgi:4-amino-4-deoxy-L-arabinose transferase-like glycosyltransferase